MAVLEFIIVKKMKKEYFQRILLEIMIMLDAYVYLGSMKIVLLLDIKILLLENLTNL